MTRRSAAPFSSAGTRAAWLPASRALPLIIAMGYALGLGLLAIVVVKVF